MLIRNNTSKKLVLYLGRLGDETPEEVIRLEIGKTLELSNLPAGDISIQED